MKIKRQVEFFIGMMFRWLGNETRTFEKWKPLYVLSNEIIIGELKNP